MIRIPRGVIRSFRTLARKCVSGRPRGPAPVVVCEVSGGTLRVWTKTTDAVLQYTVPIQGDDDRIVVPMEAFSVVGGTGDTLVEFQVDRKLHGVASWSERGKPCSHPFDAIRPSQQHRLPDTPDDWHPIPAVFLSALYECGRTARPSQTRFALHRVQVKGQAGLVIGTDSQTALVCGGLRFPFRDDILIPALPVFGVSELAGQNTVQIGRTPEHLIVRVKAWQVYLPIDTKGSFPDVANVIPRGSPTRATIDERDAVMLFDRLRSLPNGDEECDAITIDFQGKIVVRTQSEKMKRVEQILLERSIATGPFARVALPRDVFIRALSLRCNSVRVSPGRPIVWEGCGMTLISMPLDSTEVDEPADDTVKIDTAGPAHHVSESNITTTVRRAVRNHETNGHASATRSTSLDEPSDPLAEAEALRQVLADATLKVGRLITALKAQRKEKKALAHVWAGLKQLKLEARGRP